MWWDDVWTPKPFFASSNFKLSSLNLHTISGIVRRKRTQLRRATNFRTLIIDIIHYSTANTYHKFLASGLLIFVIFGEDLNVKINLFHEKEQFTCEIETNSLISDCMLISTLPVSQNFTDKFLFENKLFCVVRIWANNVIENISKIL